MGAILIKRNHLIGNTGEVVGYKSGLGLTLEEFNDIIPSPYHPYWFGESESFIRIRAEEYEELIAHLLHKLGNTESPNIPFISSKYLKIKDKDSEIFNIFLDLFSLFSDFLKNEIEEFKKDKLKSNKINPTPFIEFGHNKYGIKGRMVAIDILEQYTLKQHVSPWGKIRMTNWVDVAELKGLFESESLSTFYGKFIDQRYIDYLSHNFDSINEINWRKFEALTCEFFHKNGYYVEIGEGRDDDGIDARIWSKEENKTDPPAILIQCKRYRSKIEKMVVKSLYADVLEYGAQSGLIVTTSSLSPGAEKTCIARKYPIEQANRESLKKWIENMRSPYTGIFMSE